jgi:hypothetical protein
MVVDGVPHERSKRRVEWWFSALLAGNTAAIRRYLTRERWRIPAHVGGSGNFFKIMEQNIAALTSDEGIAV